MASNVVRMSPMAAGPPQPSQQDWVWDGANWVWCGPPAPFPPCPPFPSPPPCPPAGFPTPCPPWFPPPAAQAPWYPGANGGVSFSATAPVNPVRGHLWWDGTTLHMFDGAAWVTIGPSVGGTVMGVTDGSSAAPGFVGEVIKQTTTGSLVVTAGTGNPTTFNALVVPPGDWNIQGMLTLSNLLPAGCFLNEISFNLGIGSTNLTSYTMNAAFAANSGFIGGTYSCNAFQVTTSSSVSISSTAFVQGGIGTPNGTINYSFLGQGRRMR